MKIPMPWEKGIIADIRRSLFKRALKRRVKKLTRINRETVLAVALAVVAVGLLARGGGMIVSKSTSAVRRRRDKEATATTA